MGLTDTFNRPESKATKVLVMVRLKDAMAMKRDRPEATWVTTFGWFYDEVSAVTKRNGGRVVKYLADGVMMVFDQDNASDAINSAIQIQEAMASGNDSNRINGSCSIGIACGDVYEFQMEHGINDFDYIGRFVDQASLLAEAANADAIFADADTTAAARMTAVKSKLGEARAPKQKSAEYQGPQEKISLSDGMPPVAYHEILWSDRRYGVSPPFVTKQTNRTLQRPTPALDTISSFENRSSPRGAGFAERRPGSPRVFLTPDEERPTRPVDRRPEPQGSEWHRGHVTWKGNFGFIRSANEEFYTNPEYFLSRDFHVKDQDCAYFHPLPALPNSQKRRAADTLILGNELTGQMTTVGPRFGFAEVDSGDRRRTRLFILFNGDEGLAVGDVVRFTLGENDQGPIGINPKKA